MAGYAKRIFQSNQGLRAANVSRTVVNREKDSKASAETVRALTVTGMPDGRFAVIAKELDSFNCYKRSRLRQTKINSIPRPRC